MIATKIDLKELSQVIAILIKDLSTKPTASADYNDWLFVIGKIRNSCHGRITTSYHVVAHNKVTHQFIEKRAETYQAIKEFLITTVIVETNEGSWI